MASPDELLAPARAWLERRAVLERAHADGKLHARTPDVLKAFDLGLEEAVARALPASHALLGASKGALYYSLPVAFDPGEAIGCYLATVDRDEHGEPWRFLDLGALIMTRAHGENDVRQVAAVLAALPSVVNRYAHSEYQTTLSLRLKAALDGIAPPGTPNHFVVNTGAEAVENAIKAALLVRSKQGEAAPFVISFEGAFHGRTLGALAVTHRKKARLGFPTFDWPQAPFPFDEPKAPAATARREERSLRAVWDLLVTGRVPGAPRRPRTDLEAEIARIDRFLADGGDAAAFVAAERERLPADVLGRARRVAAVLVEPIQGEGGVRLATPRFFRRLRLLTAIYGVPLILDEVQAGFGTTGTMWAHEHYGMPLPPDVVTWAKKAQNGVLFVSDPLALFFQEEKKFNTTWEGDSVGMIRLLAEIDALDLAEIKATATAARAKLEALVSRHKLLTAVRGIGLMLGVEVARPDLRDVIRDRAFRRGLILLPAGERVLRFYPRADTPPAVMDEAIGIFEAAIADVVGGAAVASLGPNLRPGARPCPIGTLAIAPFDAKMWPTQRAAIAGIEIERYSGAEASHALLRYPTESLDATVHAPRAIGIAATDGVSGRVIGYALGAPLEGFDEEGVADDPTHGEGTTFYLQAMAVTPSVANAGEVENALLDAIRARAAAEGFTRVAMLIEETLRDTGPAWLRAADVGKTVDSYLLSGVRFAYLTAPV